MSFIPGFSLIASITNEGDKRIVSFSANPSTVTASNPFYLLWQTDSVPYIRIYGGTFDTGAIANTGSGQVQVPNGITSTTLFTIQGLDSYGNLLTVSGISVQKSIYVIVN